MDPEWPVPLLSSCAPPGKLPLSVGRAMWSECKNRVGLEGSGGLLSWDLGVRAWVNNRLNYYNHVETPQEKQSSWPQGDPRTEGVEFQLYVF